MTQEPVASHDWYERLTTAFVAALTKSNSELMAHHERVWWQTINGISDTLAPPKPPQPLGSLRYSELAAKVEADARAAVADLDATIAQNDALIALWASRNAFRTVDLAQILSHSEARP